MIIELADPNTKFIDHFDINRGVGMILCPGTTAKLRQGEPRLLEDLGIMLEPTIFGIAISGRVPEDLRGNLETMSNYNVIPKIAIKNPEPLTRREVVMTSDNDIEGEYMVEGGKLGSTSAETIINAPDKFRDQNKMGEQELATKRLNIQRKTVYIDGKQNESGKFMKITERDTNGRRNKVFLALSTVEELGDHLSLFNDFYANLDITNPDTPPENGELRSEIMVKDNRRYYLDLKVNSRGYYF